jgi:protein TonB
MFEQALVTGRKAQTTQNVVLAAILQSIAVALLIIIPAMFVQKLPEVTTVSELIAPPLALPPPPPAAGRTMQPKVVKAVTPKVFNPNTLTEPKTVSKVAVDLPQPELAALPSAGGVPGGVPGGIAGGQIGGVLGGVIGGVPQAAPPPPPPPPQTEAPKPAPERVRVFGNIEAAKLEHQVLPIYPVLASQARVQGVVKLSAVIGKDGHVEDLKVISGHPLLISSALDAVRQWLYQPTILNGNPVEVQTEVDVTFQMS